MFWTTLSTTGSAWSSSLIGERYVTDTSPESPTRLTDTRSLMAERASSVSTVTRSWTARELAEAWKSLTYCWAWVALVTSPGGATVADVT